LTIDAVGADIKIGPVSAYPSMRIITRHDDNIYESASNEKSSPIVIVNPAVTLLMEDNVKTLTLDYDSEVGTYTDSSRDNYTDHKLIGVF